MKHQAFIRLNRLKEILGELQTFVVTPPPVYFSGFIVHSLIWPHTHGGSGQVPLLSPATFEKIWRIIKCRNGRFCSERVNAVNTRWNTIEFGAALSCHRLLPGQIPFFFDLIARVRMRPNAISVLFRISAHPTVPTVHVPSEPR